MRDGVVAASGDRQSAEARLGGENDEVPPILEVRDLVQEFVIRDHGGVRGGVLQAVSGVSLDVWPGETVGIVGETGSGKSTLARSIVQAPPPKSGSVVFRGIDLVGLSSGELLKARRNLQMIFQDPYTSLDPTWRVGRLIAEPLSAYHQGTGRERRIRTTQLLELVGLDPAVVERRARELSGGQAQRVAIARALALSPALIICDEALSSLDVLIQAQILNLLERLRSELDLSYLFIAHDLALVKQVSDRVVVMYLGKLCEVAPVRALYAQPAHPYTRALLQSIPSVEVDRSQPLSAPIAGDVPSALDPPSGCRFRTRCERAQQLCAEQTPELRSIGPGHSVACHFPLVDVAV